ncbi:PAS domain S-box protein [Thermoanaerobacter siderophilus]|uniref:PAS domain S-box protein n=1 Tax=Thermoanaerobacter siderophilus TaxID=106578 RepID=UPI0002F9A63B|nr:PAS domain S-box protein [Thermoanaerobacter siderophilus]
MGLENEMYKYIIENSTNGVVVTDEEFLIKFANKMASYILEVERENIIGKKLNELIDLECKNENIRNNHYTFKVVYKTKVILIDELFIDEEGMAKGFVFIFQDVSKYEYIVDELNKYKELNNMLKAIIDSSYDGIYVTDGEANTILVNKAYERITGITADLVLGHNMKELVEKGFYSQSGSLLVMERGTQVTLRQRLLSGKEILITSIPVYDSDGKMKYIVTNVRDISELVKLQEELSATKVLNEKYRSELEYIKEKRSRYHNWFLLTKL